MFRASADVKAFQHPCFSLHFTRGKDVTIPKKAKKKKISRLLCFPAWKLRTRRCERTD